MPRRAESKSTFKFEFSSCNLRWISRSFSTFLKRSCRCLDSSTMLSCFECTSFNSLYRLDHSFDKILSCNNYLWHESKSTTAASLLERILRRSCFNVEIRFCVWVCTLFTKKKAPRHSRPSMKMRTISGVFIGKSQSYRHEQYVLKLYGMILSSHFVHQNFGSERFTPPFEGEKKRACRHKSKRFCSAAVAPKKRRKSLSSPAAAGGNRNVPKRPRQPRCGGRRECPGRRGGVEAPEQTRGFWCLKSPASRLKVTFTKAGFCVSGDGRPTRHAASLSECCDPTEADRSGPPESRAQAQADLPVTRHSD